jgi:hypothetical protein
VPIFVLVVGAEETAHESCNAAVDYTPPVCFFFITGV